MFQSSRIASGNWFLQVSIASSPFSASEIWKSRPSRIRRATLRMTLESSTTKQVFIVSSLSPEAGQKSLAPVVPKPKRTQFTSSGGRLRPEVEHAVDVEHDEK